MSDINKIPLDAQCSCGHDEPARLVSTPEVFVHKRTGIWVDTIRRYYECSNCADPFTGERPFRFVTPELNEVLNAELNAAWGVKHGFNYFPWARSFVNKH